MHPSRTLAPAPSAAQFDNPNPASVACDEAYQLYKVSPAAYVARQRAETAAYKLKYNVDG